MNLKGSLTYRTERDGVASLATVEGTFVFTYPIIKHRKPGARTFHYLCEESDFVEFVDATFRAVCTCGWKSRLLAFESDAIGLGECHSWVLNSNAHPHHITITQKAVAQ